MTRYAELDVTTNFTFLRGGSHPEELVATAKALGLDAIAVTDATRLPASCAPISPPRRSASNSSSAPGSICKMRRACWSYPRDRAAYGRLCRLLTLGQRRAEKGQCTLYLDDVAAHAEGLIFIALPPEDFPSPCNVERSA